VAVATSPEVLEAACADVDSSLDQVLASERSAEVHAGLDRLSDMDRQTLVAFYVHGESLLEMSQAFAAPIGTIKRRLHVARKRLAEELAPLSEA
jgi:RNA polymerase sigma-70 factor, ECF subfamily